MAVRMNEEARGLEEDVHRQNLLLLESDWVGKRKAGRMKCMDRIGVGSNSKSECDDVSELECSFCYNCHGAKATELNDHGQVTSLKIEA
ncbi:hypothetical protein ACFX2I_028322 [Malus domestica]